MLYFLLQMWGGLFYDDFLDTTGTEYVFGEASDNLFKPQDGVTRVGGIPYFWQLGQEGGDCGGSEWKAQYFPTT